MLSPPLPTWPNRSSIVPTVEDMPTPLEGTIHQLASCHGFTGVA
jgi:hypothetical protein